jgi:hypothetical protein
MREILQHYQCMAADDVSADHLTVDQMQEEILWFDPWPK